MATSAGKHSAPTGRTPNRSRRRQSGLFERVHSEDVLLATVWGFVLCTLLLFILAGTSPIGRVLFH